MNKLSIKEFIKHTKDNPLDFIGYCEIILTPGGNVIICSPSHTETCIQYAMERDKRTKDEIVDEIKSDLCLPLEWIVDKYRLVAVWHCGYLHSSKGLTALQKKSIHMLEENNLITLHNPYIREANEYTMYLKRKEMRDSHQ